MSRFLILALLCLCSSAIAQEEPAFISLEDLRAKYEDSRSQYVTLDGVEIHYRDEGSGPTVLLLHASWLNLQAWDDLAADLSRDHRVVRFDFPNGGLSGPETKDPPGGKFNLIERNLEILSLFVEALNLDEFNLISTSSGGSVGFRYAGNEPDRITRKVLINSAGMPRTRQTDPNRDRSDVAQWQRMAVRPPEFWAYSMDRNFPSLDEAPDDLVELAYDMNRCSDRTPVSSYFFETGDPQQLLAKIKAPTLILWGKANPTVMHLEADVMQHWMTGAPTLIAKYEGLGHYPYIEAPDTVSQDVRSFLAGEMDAELRKTQRVKVDF